ncbi:hypothetical protein D3C85_1577380 [compost metagenome]
MEATTVFTQHKVNRAGDRCEQLKVIHKILWHSVIRTDNWNAVFVTELHRRLTNPHQHLDMDNIGFKVFDDLFHLALRRKRNAEVLIKRERNGDGTRNNILTINLLRALASLAWRNY